MRWTAAGGDPYYILIRSWLLYRKDSIRSANFIYIYKRKHLRVGEKLIDFGGNPLLYRRLIYESAKRAGMTRACW